MELYSTRNHRLRVSLEEAIFKGLPDDNGLYMPVRIPQLGDDFFRGLSAMTMPEIGFVISQLLLAGEIPSGELQKIVEQSIDFPAPLVSLDDERFVLELWHGPSMAFKDFGARFMAQLMQYFNRFASRELVILVATSGDTGGAVASGFYGVAGIKVVILYPSGKVSELQEKQLTSWGGNIKAVEVKGTFDDCQAMVKAAFLDRDLKHAIRLSSANSINISRLIPQSFYYFEAYRQLLVRGNRKGRPLVFSVPSGNFGNLTAGLLAQRMGLTVEMFVAATNANDVVPQYLQKGEFSARSSVPTLSNAMDVGNPSNFERMYDLFQSQVEKTTALLNDKDVLLTSGIEYTHSEIWRAMQGNIAAYAVDDETTKQAVREVFHKYHYLIDPHAAVGYVALNRFLESKNKAKDIGYQGVVLETAHPAKFLPDMEDILGQSIPVPERLAVLQAKTKYAVTMGADFLTFKDWLIEHYG
jgi:threonine synthase